MDSSIAVLQSRICSFSLANGMKWIVLERHNAPVVSCYTYASVGASSEEDGCTGLAHLLVCVIHLSFIYLFIFRSHIKLCALATTLEVVMFKKFVFQSYVHFLSKINFVDIW